MSFGKKQPTQAQQTRVPALERVANPKHHTPVINEPALSLPLWINPANWSGPQFNTVIALTFIAAFAISGSWRALKLAPQTRNAIAVCDRMFDNRFSKEVQMRRSNCYLGALILKDRG